MTALTPDPRQRQKDARARAGRIRLGMVNYLETLALVAQARANDDHIALGYSSWAEYLDHEFGKERLQLTAEMREKAVTELRLAGASQREIAYTTGLSASTVNRALAGPRVSNETDESDAYPDSPADSPLVEAMKTAIGDATDRAPDRRDDTPGDPGEPVGPAAPDEAGASSTPAAAEGAGPTPVPSAPQERIEEKCRCGCPNEECA